MNDNALNPFNAPTENSGTRQVTSVAGSTDASRAVAEVQAAMMIARMNPRDEIGAMNKILNACMRPTLADSSMYTYSKGGTEVTGASIRLAEAIAQSWGNMQFGMRELDQVNGESTVQAYAWDVESNTRREITFQVPHIRYKKNNQSTKLTDPREIYELVANQGARRLRACILAVIPGDVTEAAVVQCEKTMRTKADTSPEAIQKMVDTFLGEFNVTKEHIQKRIQRSIESIAPAQVVSLKKIYVSLRDNMSAPSDWFEINDDDPKPAAATAAKNPPAKGECSDAQFAKDLPGYAKTIKDGKKTAAQVISMAKTRWTLSDTQEKTILAIEPEPKPATNEGAAQ